MLEKCGHTASVVMMTAEDMIKNRMTAAEHILNQLRKDSFIESKDIFDLAAVNTSDISSTNTYCGDSIFIPSFARHFCKTGRSTSTTDANHCQGVGAQSYSTVIRVSAYGVNGHSIPLFFSQSVGKEG